MKTKFNKPLLEAARPFLPKILFATTTELYSSIVASAAAKCHMPFHINRWLSGTITAASSYIDDFEQWSFLTNDLHKENNNFIQEKFFKRKKDISQQTNQLRKYQLGRKPSLIIIPDVSNNEMIIKETNILGIPVLGIVNSNCQSEIAYPIFANDFSIYSIHFFCHFLSSLITKEIVKSKHKLHILPKKTIRIQFARALKKIFHFNTRVFKFKYLKKNKQTDLQYIFKGRYFFENLVKPKIKLRKMFQRKNQISWKKKIQKSFDFAKKTHFHWKSKAFRKKQKIWL